ncbi:hypothetical protein BV509_13055 [Rhodovulum sulfidophilum]|uniref:Uncharacterized protein n=1 Tax=Rhodovulum visakhapatnamense TaxID=364297 RepID=A0ABS1RFK9_9RHOB|nr:hypothetical protein [Rhodovulum visakhapatnamense]MBL3570033.1 hypothetical protein [Rhodovulum visakhapatnamense]MBL3578299.1 hypothetical protein [Rhodovulum visakhapatnamense]OLS45180.1 hypothetical protein BV509_13055 [Rhodovulum sulfidophilum]
MHDLDGRHPAIVEIRLLQERPAQHVQQGAFAGGKILRRQRAELRAENRQHRPRPIGGHRPARHQRPRQPLSAEPGRDAVGRQIEKDRPGIARPAQAPVDARVEHRKIVPGEVLYAGPTERTPRLRSVSTASDAPDRDRTAPGRISCAGATSRARRTPLGGLGTLSVLSVPVSAATPRTPKRRARRLGQPRAASGRVDGSR